MKRREVGKYHKRIEIDLERRDGSVVTVLKEHWTLENDPLSMATEAASWLHWHELPDRPTAGFH